MEESSLDDAQVLSLLTRVNTWWEDEPVPRSLMKIDFQRRDFFVLRDWLTRDFEVLPIRGPRQVGKTTTIGQLIEYLLNEEQVTPTHILYINMENSIFLSASGNTISESISTYESNILAQSLGKITEDVYIFIDEIQKSNDWPSILKYYTDTYARVKFIVTGSISTLITDDARETLVGRLKPFTMVPMKFIEYVRYENLRSDDQLYNLSTDLRKSLKDAVLSHNSNEFTNELARIYGVLDPVRPELENLRDRYLLKGGYPGVLDKDYVNSFNMLDSDLRSIVTGDMPNIYPIEKPTKLLQILNLIAHSSGSKINVSSISTATDLNHRTVEKYLSYLEDFFLINRSLPYSHSPYQSGGKPKMYIQDVGHRNALQGTFSERTLENSEEMGKILETACRELADRLQFYLLNYKQTTLSYWDANGEVDLVLAGSGFSLPLEVKHGDSTKRELSGLRNFVSEHDNASFGLAINKANVLKDSGDIIHIPAWLFFFMC